jgi:hypothetical protein
MPTLMAMVVGSLLAYMVEDAISPYVGRVAAAVISLFVMYGVYFSLRRWLVRLRDGD